MADVTLYGVGASTYVRTCRMALAEKGVAYELVENMPNSPEQLDVHPWGKVPAFAHGDVHLHEALAISHYVDAAFDGPALRPADAAGRARVDQFVSAFIDYMYGPIVRNIIVQRLVVPQRGGTPDENVVAAGVPGAEKALGLVDGTLAGSACLVGDEVTIADFFLLPVINYFAATPEGGEMLSKAGNLAAWMVRMNERPSAAVARLG